jgi:hypothetical protein
VASGPGRSTTLTLGVMAEVLLAGSLLIWRTGVDAAAAAAFGAMMSSILVVAAMVILAVAMVTLLLSARLSRGFRLSVVVLTSFATGFVGVLALVSLLGAGDGTDTGVGLLLAMSWVCMVFLAVGISRANVSARKTSRETVRETAR